MQPIRRTWFDSPALQIGSFEYRPVAAIYGDVERQPRNVMVLPIAGVFAKHDAPGRQVLGTPSHAVFIAADTPYRLGFPGGIGDRSLTLRFGSELAPEHLDARGADPPASQGLLPAQALLLRQRLWSRLAAGEDDTLAIEAAAFELLDLALAAIGRRVGPQPAATLERRRRALDRVKEAVAAAPAERWSIARLARLAHLSPFHLCHLFRQMTGTSIHRYVLRERLAQALEPVLDGADLTGVALDAGFASHSHFTARFHRFFGCTPAALRRDAQLRKTVTARRRRSFLG